jgi:nuclear GTP-binding protein
MSDRGKLQEHKRKGAKTGYQKRKSQFSSDNVSRTVPGKGGGGNIRDKSTIKRIEMYRTGKGIRNKSGKLIGGQYMMSTRAGDKPITAATGRVQPDRRWFGNTRVISQKELDKFREEMSTKVNDPYSVVLRRNKLPMSLLSDATPTNRCHILETESYESVFSGKKTRKKPKIESSDLEAMVSKATSNQTAYEDKGKDINIVEGCAMDTKGKRIKNKKTNKAIPDFPDAPTPDVFLKGQSKRIWAELYKVLDCSDVVLQVLDARNIPGTRSLHVENYLKKNASHKHLILIINKCDLVPTWVTKKWVRILSAEYPTLAFHASLNNSFGKGSLIQLLRQFAVLHQDKKQISVGLIGAPNVGKSSIINTLKKKKVCNVAPIPGETKVWQYITLMRRIYLIDCPGHIYDEGETETDTVLKGRKGSILALTVAPSTSY